jgi:putative membrane protein
MRPVPFTLGLVTLLGAWGWLLMSSAGPPFWAHMTIHMSVVAVAAPFLAIGLAGSRYDPVRQAPSLFSPLLASLIELGVVWLWHTPVLHSAARAGGTALIAEQATFILSGCLLWMSAFGGEPGARPGRSASGIIALLLTAMHMTLLGALLALSPRPLYAHVHGHSGLSSLEDQHLGGAIMLLVGGVSYLAGGLWLSSGLLRRSASHANGA